MSKNISIDEGNEARTFSSTKRLWTKLTGGGQQAWIPEDEIISYLGNIDIDANGTYRAEDYNVPGWRSINVKVVTGSAVGTDPESGEEVIVEPDPETGELVETVLPTAIRITTQPTKTQYNQGEAIDISGIVVTAYTALGNVWTNEDYPDGIIPVAELMISPTVANSRNDKVSVSWKRPKDSRRLGTTYDITVSAEFTVTFMNGETVLEVANNVPYGGTAFYTGETPAKEGYLFTGWLPEPVNVREDLVCYAQFDVVRWTADSEFLVYEANTLLATIRAWGPRYYYKKNEGKAITAYIQGYKSNLLYDGPYLISTIPDTIVQHLSWNGEYDIRAIGYVVYQNVKWYYSAGYWVQENPQGINPNAGGVATTINVAGSINNHDDLVLFVLRTANVQVFTDPIAPTLTLSPSSLALTSQNPTGDVTITTNSDGAITVSSSDASIASAAVSGTTVRVTAGATTGTATITVSVAATDIYEAASATITVTNGDSSHNSGNI